MRRTGHRRRGLARPQTVKIDAGRFQFKSGGDAQGVNRRAHRRQGVGQHRQRRDGPFGAEEVATPHFFLDNAMKRLRLLGDVFKTTINAKRCSRTSEPCQDRYARAVLTGDSAEARHRRG